MRRTPSTQALRALVSFSRCGSVAEAAQELHLTRSAISHQLRLLERDLGFELFKRVGTRIELTVRGRSYAKDIAQALSLISGSASRNAGHLLTGQLTVSCTPGFAASWLSIRVANFRVMYPDINLSVVVPKTLDDVSNPDVDVFVAFGDGNMKDVDIELLQEVEFTPLVSPVLLNRLGGLARPEDVFRGNLLHLVDRNDWRAWLSLAGLPRESVDAGIVFADMNLVFAAAVNAQGIALGDEFICHKAMESGKLIRPFDLAIKSEKSYYLVTPLAKAELASVIAFRQWILSEVNG